MRLGGMERADRLALGFSLLPAGFRSNAVLCVRRALTLEGPSSDAFHPSSQLAEGGAMALRNVAQKNDQKVSPSVDSGEEDHLPEQVLGVLQIGRFLSKDGPPEAHEN